MNNSSEVALHEVESDVNELIYLFSAVCVLWTVCANLLILWCFFDNRRRKWTDFSRLACSMSVSDALVAVTASPTLIREYQGGQATTVACAATFYFFFSIQSVSLLHVLGICIFRIIKLKTMSSVYQISNKTLNANWVIVIAWVLALSLIVIPFVAWARRDHVIMFCYINNIFGTDYEKALFYFGIFFMTTQMLTNTIYILTCCRLWLAIRKIAPVNVSVVQPAVSLSGVTGGTPGARNPTSGSYGTSGIDVLSMTRPLVSTLKSQKHVMGTIGILLVLFNVFTMPVTVAMLSENMQSSDRNVRYIICTMFVINSGINPIVYATRIDSLRASVKNVFRKLLSPLRC